MDKRDEDLVELRSYIEGVDKEVTMLLQSLQWDRKHLLERSALVPCRYDATHKVPPDKKESHEKECLLRCEGYSKDDIMLPDPLDPDAATVVKLSKEDIQHVIECAAQADPSFRRGRGCPDVGPFTAERLRACYSADELRAIHDHVVSSAPDFEHVEDIDFASAEVKAERRRKSRLEVLAELRDMRRRRAKYRGAGASAASKNYSNVLRDLIKTQMELYTGAPVDSAPVIHPSTAPQTSTNRDNTIHIKQEPVSDDESRHTREHNRGNRYSQRNDNRGRSYRENNGYRKRDNSTGRSHRDDKERHRYVQERETNKHAYDKRRRDEFHVKEDPLSDEDDHRQERRKERESHEFKEKHRPKDRHDETQRHSKTNEKCANDSYRSKSDGKYSDSRREASKDKRYSRDRDNGHSKSKTKREDSDYSSSRDAHSSRKHEQGQDHDSRNESHHKRTKCRDKSRSKTKKTDRSSDDNIYKRYYAMKRALADEHPKR